MKSNLTIISIALFFCLTGLGGNCIFAQTKPAPKAAADERNSALKRDAATMLTALELGEFEKFADYMHAKAIKKLGSRAEVVEFIRDLANVTAKGLKGVRYIPDNPGPIVTSGRQLFGIVPYRLMATTPRNESVVATACAVGISDNRGKSWTFATCETFGEIFPTAAKKISIPQPKMTLDGVEQF